VLKRRRPLDNAWLERAAKPHRDLLVKGRHLDLEASLGAMALEDRDMVLERALLRGVNPTPWVDAMPDSALAHVALARHLLDRHDDLWLKGRRDRVELELEAQALRRRARSLLERASSLDPTEPLVASVSLRGLLVEPLTYGALVDLHASTALVAPGHYASSANLVAAMSGRKAGTSAMALEFARSLQALPEGVSARALVAVAHVEAWAVLVAEGGVISAEGYFLDPAVQEELRDAALSSVLNVHHQRSLATVEVLNVLAFAFLHADDTEMLKRALVAADGEVSAYPWQLRGRDDVLVRRAREYVDLD
jgi:hypothetical protein